MNITIRKLLTTNSLSRRLYCIAREAYNSHQMAKLAGRYFLNARDFKDALAARSGSALLDLKTADGLTITIRRNRGDAMTVAEIFLCGCYSHHLTLDPNPIVIDVGGFIGDFSLYAVKYFNARRVIVCEPSPRNWAILTRNIANNGYKDYIIPVNKAVTADGEDTAMNIETSDERQCMVSAFYPTGQPLSAVPGVSLGQLFKSHHVEDVDLLKIDVEGGEYAILERIPSDMFSRIRNIVFEYHDIEGGWSKLEHVKQRLCQEGYTLSLGRGLVTASRSRSHDVPM